MPLPLIALTKKNTRIANGISANTNTKKAIEIATKHNKIVGSATLATDEKTLTMLHDMGIKMITCGADFNYIVNGAKATYETVRKVIGK